MTRSPPGKPQHRWARRRADPPGRSAPAAAVPARSPRALAKAATKQTPADLPVHSFGSLPDTIDEADHIALMANLIGVRSWPARRLLIPAVDVETGLPVVWDREAGVSLAVAVAASTAFPASAPPVSVKGRRYMDGALRAGTNLDLVAGAEVVVVLEPVAHLFGIDDDPVAVRILPDSEAVEALGPDPGDSTRWEPAYSSGTRQAVQCVERVRRAWI